MRFGQKEDLAPIFQWRNQEEYIIFLNWLPNWFSVYFIGKFSDYILVTIFIILIFSIFYFKDIFFSKLKNIKNNLKIGVFFYFTLSMIFFLWFFNFPSLRYAGYIIVFLMIIFPYSVFVSNKIDFSKKQYKKTFNHFSDFLLNFFN